MTKFSTWNVEILNQLDISSSLTSAYEHADSHHALCGKTPSWCNKALGRGLDRLKPGWLPLVHVNRWGPCM
ncbi:hypothetical protein A9K55_001737 [Cordyceps militaris]|uniref:Uncharacterized protein n=1 Tax=Cordyceps militaris TaxID=73501 RepID=A0A2H4SQP1_CORMI|nr:hypothetical protein A9K55_001737 [Cordyceps militaris]